ncbi:hypothetical protein L6452_28059 [Arctium lappa]|uniref:Uncharacterized protein n=1 Tax=Arctium lappa TaxID=4217 RepID=A0ACB9A1R3_ARCLA|nr:hypothetical protein L6452_28059 [Arctium lappa]
MLQAKRSLAVDVLTIDLYNALNDKSLAERKNNDLTEQLEKCHEKIRELTLLEESLKDQVVVNKNISIEREQAIAALKAENATVEKWCNSSTKITKIINAQTPGGDKTGLGFWIPQDEPKEDCSLLKFGTFVTSISDTSYNQFYPSSSNSIPEEKFKGYKSVDKGKSILHPQKASKKAKLKVPSKPSTNQSSSSVIEIFDLCPPKLKIDLKPKRSEETKILPRSHAKSILGPGPSHLKFSKPSTSGPKTTFKYRKCYHYGFTDHIARKCPTATKAVKSAKVKMNASKAEKVIEAEKLTKMKNTTKGSKGIWYLDSGCSLHMTGQKDLLTEYKEEKGPSVTFGGNGKGYTRGFGVLSNATTTFRRVVYVYGLKHNLLSISQLCDKDYEVSFSKKACSVVNEKGKLALSGYRRENVYVIDMDSTISENICFLSKASSDVNWLWHKRLSHLNFKTLNSLSSKELVSGLPQHSYAKESLCSAYGSTDNLTVRSIRSDHGTEFENSSLNSFFENKGISHNFSSMFIAESKTKLLNNEKSTSDLMRISVKQRQLYQYAKEQEKKLQR